MFTGHLPISSRLLGPSSVELDLVYCPHGSLYVFQTYKAFMETEIMSDGILGEYKKNQKKSRKFNVNGTKFFTLISKNISKSRSSYLPSSCITPEICKVSCEPVIDFI